MQDISHHTLEKMLANRDPVTAVFVYTPLCGTCKLASKMMTVVESALEPFPIFSLNINHSPAFAQNWKIKSVPCLLLFQKGLGVERIYAFHSIGYLHSMLKPYAAVRALMEKKTN
ncbi:thioredoxin family protein [Alkalihalobacillus sp. MEB130]|uniref:thioredoxin family protein n=1 Tax=Alkalihalobacillus sp. MEB130 TaxID=2976704 RepID=UPI0028DD4455|nr:thioredoxin family protein [Alkalihalobacillus sp. MEB130]MDT8859952.1 thioredoxin family protein [Alkalihalobacillus sp. MEB130]